MERISVVPVKNASDFALLREEWNGFVRTVTKSPFSSHEWLSTYWAHYGGGNDLFVLLARTDTGELVGVCPLQIRKRSVAGVSLLSRASLIGTPLTDIQDMLVIPGLEIQALGKFVEAIEDMGIDYLDLDEIPEHSPTRGWAVSVRGRMDVEEYVTSRLPFVELPGSWAEFLASRGTSTQRNLKYYGNRLSKKFNLAFLSLTDPDHIDQELPAFFQLYEKRFAQYPVLTAPSYRKFRSEVVRLFTKNGWLILFMLKLNGQPVAAELCLRSDDTLYAYNSCYDADWSREGTTLILQGNILEYAIRNRFCEYDFLRGEEPYKAHWATGTRQHHSLHFKRLNWRVRLVEQSRDFRSFASKMISTERAETL